MFDKFIQDCFTDCRPSFCSYSQFEQLHDKFKFDVLASLNDPNSEFLEFYDIVPDCNLINIVKNIQDLKTTNNPGVTLPSNAVAASTKRKRRTSIVDDDHDDVDEQPPNKRSNVCKNLMDKINNSNSESSLDDLRKLHFIRLLKSTCSILTDYIQ